MFKKSISIAVVVALINLLAIVPAFAGSTYEKESRLAVRVKENIQKIGTGEASKVKITLKDKSKIEGYVSRIDDESFTVTSFETGQTAEIEYARVKKVKGGNLSTGAKIAIGVGIAAVVLVIAVVANRKVCKNVLCQ